MANQSAADLAALQFKIRNGGPLTPAQRYFVMKSCNKEGAVSRRNFTGLKEYPDSEIDNRD